MGNDRTLGERTMKSWKLVAFTVAGLAGVLMACSSSSTPAPTGSGTGSGQGSSKGSGASSSGGGGGGGTGCFDMTGTGSTATCSFASSTATGFTCTSPEKSGSCPSSGLVGCCGDTVTEGGFSTSSYACYYDSTTASEVKAACVSPDKWTTSAP
jgi:hypothetical protein